MLRLQATGQQSTRESNDEAKPISGRQIATIEEAADAEWRVEDFRPEWLVRGWPDDWAGKPLELFAWPSREAKEAIEGRDE